MMMVSKLHKQSILTSYVNSYCLVCESLLLSEDDINSHIAKPIHKKNLDATPYVDKFKDDCVRKVKKGYFCEFCNMLMSTTAKVGLHIAEANHYNNKGTQLLKRVGKYIVFKDIMINEKAWNGFIDETCVMCNTEFSNEGIHKTESMHILNLLQKKVEFGADKAIYRKIDETSFQCLTCNTVLANDATATHFDQTEHKKLLTACIQTQAPIQANDTKSKPVAEIEKQKPKQSNESGMKSSNPVNKKPEEKVDKPKVETSIDIKKKTDNAENKKVTDIKKPGTVRRDFQIGTVEMDEELSKAFGANDYIADDEDGNKWCILCDWTMDGMTVSKHVQGRHHQTMTKMHKERMQKKASSLESKSKAKQTEVSTEKDIKTETDKEIKERENKSKIVDAVATFQKNDMNIDFVAATAVCKKCSKNVDFLFEAIESHIEDHKKKAKKETKAAPEKVTEPKVTEKNASHSGAAKTKRKDSDDKSDRASSVASSRDADDEVEKFAKLHDLAHSRSDNKVYCRVCDTRVPACLKNMKEHVNGLSHKSRAAMVLKQKLSKPVMVKKCLKDFIESIVAVENDVMKDVIINERFCINILSFLMITYESTLRCEPCHEVLKVDHLDTHKNSISHMRAMAEVPVISSVDSEFIREVRPGILHCGFCNNCHQDLEDLEGHFRSTQHREAKTAASWRLQQYMPDVAASRQREQLEFTMLMSMMMHGNPF